MALDRRTLRELVATPLFDERGQRVCVLVLATGSSWRRVLHRLGVGMPRAQRRSHDHLSIALSSSDTRDLDVEIHVVGVSTEEADHPVTEQLALRAQAVLACPDIPRPCRGVPSAPATDDAVHALHRLVEKLLPGILEARRTAPATAAPADRDEDAPPSEGTRRCALALLGVTLVTAQELLTALDAVMAESGFLRCSHAGGGRDFVLLRGGNGAGLRLLGDRLDGAVSLAQRLAEQLDHGVLAAHGEAEQTFDGMSGAAITDIGWVLHAVSARGTGAAYRDSARLREASPQLPLDERACLHIADEVFNIDPAVHGLPLHYERR